MKDQVDYKELLKKYMAWVIQQEGETNLPEADEAYVLSITPEDRSVLSLVAEEAEDWLSYMEYEHHIQEQLDILLD